jgi:hypothetical protein
MVTLALGCADFIDSAAASPSLVLRTAMITSAPRAAKARAASFPRPVFDPVMITTCEHGMASVVGFIDSARF